MYTYLEIHYVPFRWRTQFLRTFNRGVQPMWEGIVIGVIEVRVVRVRDMKLTDKEIAETIKQVKKLAKIRELYDDACAVLGLPDSTNDGGPGDLADEVRRIVQRNNSLELVNLELEERLAKKSVTN